MKKIIPVLLVLYFFFPLICFAGQGENQEPQSTGVSIVGETVASPESVAEQQVKNLPSRHGNTIDSYLTNMTKIPMAQDLGWKVSAVEDGYEVVRSILINGAKTLEYTWHVSKSGEATPANDRARKLMK